MFKNRLLNLLKILCKFYVQVPVACISSSVLTFFKRFVCLVFFIIFCFFFKINSGVFVHNRVATLVLLHHKHEAIQAIYTTCCCEVPQSHKRL